LSARGRFISFEGGEGAGKTTQLGRLLEYLAARDVPVVATREPGGTEVGEAIRAILLDKTLPAMQGDTEALLMYAARVEHVATLIRPALAAGQWVVSDRFADASHVYQGAGRGLGDARLSALEQWCLGDFQPDLTILLDVPVEVGMERVRQRGEKDRFEEEDRAFFQRVREAYLARAARYPARFLVIDASQDTDRVSRQIEAKVAQWLSQP